MITVNKSATLEQIVSAYNALHNTSETHDEEQVTTMILNWIEPVVVSLVSGDNVIRSKSKKVVKFSKIKKYVTDDFRFFSNDRINRSAIAKVMCIDLRHFYHVTNTVLDKRLVTRMVNNNVLSPEALSEFD